MLHRSSYLGYAILLFQAHRFFLTLNPPYFNHEFLNNNKINGIISGISLALAALALDKYILLIK